MSIRIDKEFESLIPPLSDEEFAQLEENCVRDGIRDALVVWKVPNGDQILVDGHNRWKISVKHGGIPFQVKELKFDLREDAIAWIIRNQFGRRNLSVYDRSVLALKLKPIIAKEAKKRMVNAPQKKAEREKEISKIWEEHDFDTARVLVAQKRQEFGREDRAEKMAGEKCIYFARFGDNQLKIGSSVNPEGRVKQLSVSCPGIKLVEVIHYGAGAEKHENAIKRKYGQYRIGNECYQCSDEILSEMIAFTKKEAARKSNTDYELAKVAGVSHDTIHKVEVIEKKGTPALIEDVRKGDTTINKAYQIVTGDTPKSPQKAMRELLQKKTEEHEQFLEKKNDKVVDLNDVREDNERMKLLASKFYTDWLHMDKLAFNMLFDINENLDFKGIMKALSDSQKAEMKQTITSMRQMADELEGRLLNGE